MALEARVLGEFEARLDDVVLHISAAKLRQLLALLALNGDRVVTKETLFAELWADGGPRSSSATSNAATLHTYVGKVRRELQTAGAGIVASEVLRTAGGGYSLPLAPGNLDAHEYERLAAQGRAAADTGRYDVASTALNEALALWRGPVLSDLNPGPPLRVEIVRLTEQRRADLDLRIEADLHLGRHQMLLGELAGLCERFPMAENFATKYMIALDRSGQRWRALTAYRDLRATLACELGIEPSPGTQGLHLSMLRGDVITLNRADTSNIA